MTDLGKYLRCVVTASNASGSGTPAPSNAVGPVAAAAAGPALTNMYLWLKADAGVYSDAGTTPAVNGGPVHRWADQSATGTRHFNQTTAGNQPTWVTNVVNSLPVIRFTYAGSPSTNDWMLGPSLSALTAGEIFIVLKKAGADPGDGTGACLWQCDGHGSSNLYPFSDGNIYDGWGCGIRNNCGDPTPSLTSWRLYNVVSTSSEWTNYIDGNLQFALGFGGVVFTAFELCHDAASGQTWGGDVAEVIVYSAKLSSADWVQTKAYIASKYGLTIASGGR